MRKNCIFEKNATPDDLRIADIWNTFTASRAWERAQIIGFVQSGTLLRITGIDPRWNEHIKSTVADGNGNFELLNIAPGDYFLECAIYWNYATQYGMRRTGGTVYKKIEVHDGEKLKVVLTE